MSYEQKLEFICSLNIDDSKKAECIYKLVLDSNVSNSEVSDFFFKHNLKSVAEEFFTFNNVKSLKRKLIAVSGSEWTTEHLEYFNIVFEDVTIDKLCTIKDLNEKAKNFIDSNKNLSALSFAGKKGKDLANAAKNDFQRKIMFVLLNPSKESCVDVMIQTLLEQILDNRFLVEQRYKMQLTICNVKKEATADLIAILFPELYIGVIVIEDKSENASNTEYQSLEAEAQMISEGVAVAQQDKWSSNIPIYMLRIMKTNVSVYKAFFSEEFIRSIKNGTRRTHPSVVYRYAPYESIEIGRSRPGLDILDPSDREILVNIIYSISLSIINCFSS